MRAANILVVDDHAEIAESVREILEEEGYRVAVAGDGEQALALFPQINPALVLLDLRLPKIDGSELVVRFRDADAASAVVAVTGSVDVPGDVSAVLRKPFDIEELLTIVRRFCGDPNAPATGPGE
jgi:two-component system response regulator MtrA